MAEGGPVKKLGFCILYYGAPYLEAAIGSVYDQVDKIVILYTDQPSQGFMPDIPCPDTEQQLMACCNKYWDKITWVNGRWGNEGDHVGAVQQFTAGYDWLWRFDSDEVTPPGMVDAMISQAQMDALLAPPAKLYAVHFINFWRSFSRVCLNSHMSIRLTRVNGGEGQKNLDSEDGKYVMYHFGYAVPSRYIAFKLQVSGHRPEFRPDWYETKWLANAQEDLHPVCMDGFWNAVPFDKANMPPILKDHPYHDMEIIE